MVVESYLTGNDYRCLVIGGVLRAVAQRVPAHVEGDGKHTLTELVEITNADPRRGIGHEKVLTRIKVDEEAVAYAREQGFELADVPPRGERVYLKRTGNMSTGGISIDRTEEAHPDNVELAELAAQVVGLDIAGIDLICPDVGRAGARDRRRDRRGQRGTRLPDAHATRPRASRSTSPSRSSTCSSRPAPPSRIPIVAVTGSNGKTTTARMIAHIMKGMGRKVGLTTTDGIYVDGRIVRKRRCVGPEVGVDGAPEPDRRLRRLRGRPRRHPARGPRLPAQRRGRRAQRDRRPPRPRRHPLASASWPRSSGSSSRPCRATGSRSSTPTTRSWPPWRATARGSVIYFSIDPEHERLKFQASRGRRAVTLEQGRNGEMIVLRQGRKSMSLVWTHLIPATFEGRARMNVQNALAATAAAWAAGAHLHDIRQGLRTFTTSYFMAPGRLNMFELDGYRVVVDYAHNPPAHAAPSASSSSG